MKKLHLSAILAAVILLTAACSLLPNQIDPNASAGSILFKDDFSDKTGGWDSVEETEGATAYTNGAYRIFVNDVNWYFWSNPGDLKFQDVSIEVDATKVAGPDENDIGLICRYVDDNNFYFSSIGSDGFYAVMKIRNGEESLVGMDEYGFNDENINTGNQKNKLRMDCIGSTITLYVNNHQIVQVEDSELSEGNVGLLAGSYETPGVDVLFDNFVVTKP